MDQGEHIMDVVKLHKDYHALYAHIIDGGEAIGLIDYKPVCGMFGDSYPLEGLQDQKTRHSGWIWRSRHELS
jgi:hypothetical protein